ncbi:MAG TPA: branched-chain-amino-acid transaminase [Methanothermobacter sp.]|jgi:branched-chain amino acid aminotransferase|uniref:Branched-chain-amino-acid aminotransferase n=1 Tax=Methanothermobacter tenebrarum TaxID=680118 RepID=A0ABM7YBM5_9EURY|nr:branched-chain-amino-acid transaminase [Methanothermobacter tenebrarum]MDD3455244.1 branched-chain-amino-acid transaminase [Methanobacteriales archaeon]MDI6882737.1 branched-chain-amino-acid transaminase [Methanothermobacter sp.]MDX9693598.1 branched-chain-amino-acid transaminase [Methanothermobacter sp.]BDH78635.1 branched chain amino acid aminotransferase [Methanothermobacter tenebrarum]HHW15975.1 branched-chain-amino-acid transaminase [Methanothermobacter sp.]
MLSDKGKIWFNNRFVEWDDAKIHVLSHVVHYGSSVFEGIRCYKNREGSAIFRLEDHVRRLFDSAKIYMMDIPYTEEEICEAVIETVKINNLKECYIRPVVFRGYKELGVNPLNCPVEVVIAAWEWGSYLGQEALEEGVDVGISTWRRMAPNTLPNMAKAGGNYLNSQLVKMEAIKHGYDEGIILDYNGMVSEGSGENIFIVKDGELYTPPVSSSLLPGITRDSVIRLANEMGINVREERIPREMLYLADELFFTGTAAEITPIRSVDGIKVGDGRRGPITEKLQESFFKILRAEVADRFEWLRYIE